MAQQNRDRAHATAFGAGAGNNAAIYSPDGEVDDAYDGDERYLQINNGYGAARDELDVDDRNTVTRKAYTAAFIL